MQQSVYRPGCTICLEPFRLTDKVVTLKCGHLFCSSCMLEYTRLYPRSGCSLCKTPITEVLNAFVQFVNDDRTPDDIIPSPDTHAIPSNPTMIPRLSSMPSSRHVALLVPTIILAIIFSHLPLHELRLLGFVLLCLRWYITSQKEQALLRTQIDDLHQVHTQLIDTEIQRRALTDKQYDERLGAIELATSHRLRGSHSQLKERLSLSEAERDTLNRRLADEKTSNSAHRLFIQDLHQRNTGLQRDCEKERQAQISLQETVDVLTALKEFFNAEIAELEAELCQVLSAKSNLRRKIESLHTCNKALVASLRVQVELARNLTTVETKPSPHLLKLLKDEKEAWHSPRSDNAEDQYAFHFGFESGPLDELQQQNPRMKSARVSMNLDDSNGRLVSFDEVDSETEIDLRENMQWARELFEMALTNRCFTVKDREI